MELFQPGIQLRWLNNAGFAVMHVSPKQDHAMFAVLVRAIRPKVVIHRRALC